MAGPATIESITVVQRDTDVSFLVDVVTTAFQVDGDDLDHDVEWRIGNSGAWSPATAQPYDRRHDVNPITGIPVASPGKALRFVWLAFFDLGEGTFYDVEIRVTLTNTPDSIQEEAGPFTIITEDQLKVTEVFQQSLNRRAIIDQTELDFLGVGLTTPFRRGSRDFVSAKGVDLIRANVSQILGTRAAVGNMMGELLWRPDFGNKLWVLRHRNNDRTLKGQAVAFVQEALRWEPRVEVTSVEILRDEDPNKLAIRVMYRIIEENVDGNFVVLPEFEEVVTITS